MRQQTAAGGGVHLLVAALTKLGKLGEELGIAALQDVNFRHPGGIGRETAQKKGGHLRRANLRILAVQYDSLTSAGIVFEFIGNTLQQKLKTSGRGAGWEIVGSSNMASDEFIGKPTINDTQQSVKMLTDSCGAHHCH